MVKKGATKARIAELLGLTTRQVSNLVEEGMPRDVDGNRVYFDEVKAVQWYIRKLKENARAGDDEKKTLSTRNLELDVRMKEIELARAEGSIVSLDYMETQVGAILQRLRATCLNAPGKYAPSMVGLRSIAESQTRLEALTTDLISSLAEISDDPELDPDADAPDGDDSLAT